MRRASRECPGTDTASDGGSPGYGVTDEQKRAAQPLIPFPPIDIQFSRSLGTRAKISAADALSSSCCPSSAHGQHGDGGSLCKGSDRVR